MTPEGQEGGADDPPGEGWVQVPGAVVVSEKTEHIVNSHQVAENRREEEEVTHCGDVTNQVSVLFTLAPLRIVVLLIVPFGSTAVMAIAVTVAITHVIAEYAPDFFVK